MASELFVNKITGTSGTSGGAPITLSGDTATLGSGADIKAAINASGTAPIYACRAFVNFDGTSVTNVSGEDRCTIRSSGNVTKVVRSTTGKFVVHYTTALPNANYTVVGYDYSPILTELGKEYGLTLHQGSFSTLEDSSILYDVIILNHVIEHFTNFNKNMNQILQYLKPDGLLFIGVPNLDNFNQGQFQNAHTYYFTPRTLKKCLTSHNLYLLDSGPASKGYHMYSVYKKKKSSTKQGFSSIETNEYNFMMKKYIYFQIRSSMVKAVSVLGLKKIIKSIWGLNNNNL